MDARPILYYLDNTSGKAEGLKAAFGCFNNPVVCWTGLLAILACGAQAFRRKRSRAIFFLAVAAVAVVACLRTEAAFQPDAGTTLLVGGILLLILGVVLWLGGGALASWAFPLRSPQALFIVMGYLSQLVPWMFIGRTTFEYHYIPTTLFLVLAISLLFDGLIERSRRWKNGVYGLTALAVGLYIAFYPVLVGLMVPTWYTSSFLKWFPSWPF